MLGKEQAERELQEAIQQWDQFFVENQQAHSQHQEQLLQMEFDNVKLKEDLRELMKEFEKLSEASDEVSTEKLREGTQEGLVVLDEEISKRDRQIKDLTEKMTNIQQRLQEETFQKQKFERELNDARKEWEEFHMQNQQVHSQYQEQLRHLECTNAKLKQDLNNLSSEFERLSGTAKDSYAGNVSLSAYNSNGAHVKEIDKKDLIIKDLMKEIADLQRRLKGEKLRKEQAETDLESAKQEWEQFYSVSMHAQEQHQQQLRKLEFNNAKLKQDLRKSNRRRARYPKDNGIYSVAKIRFSLQENKLMNDRETDEKDLLIRNLMKELSDQQKLQVETLVKKCVEHELRVARREFETELLRVGDIIYDLKQKVRREQQERLQKALDY